MIIEMPLIPEPHKVTDKVAHFSSRSLGGGGGFSWNSEVVHRKTVFGIRDFEKRKEVVGE